MTIRAIFRRRFVEQNRFALNLALQGMAHGAAHICVRPCQRELSAFIVVKRRGRPALVHMAIPTFCDSVLGRKLAAVRIRMAGFAILRRSLELNLVRTGGHLVAFVTCGRAMRSQQCKFCFRMVEASNVDPGSGAVAGFAAQGGSIGALLRHALLEFSLVGIHVAGGARPVLEMERQNLVRSSGKAGFVALRAGDGHVSPGQHKAGVLVLGNGERRAMKVLYGVAILAAVLVRRGGKLLVMRILMAIRAGRELHFVDRVFSGRRVAFVAGHGRMFSFQRIVRSRVLLHAKLRWLPALHGVALRALSLARPRLKLSFVGIRSVAICALRKGQCFLEIAAGVTIAATYFQMRAQERVFCFRMIELHRGIHFFPTGCRVAGFARSLERAFVRIGVAGDAGIEFYPRELHCLVGAGRKMALFAGHLGVHSGQGILCFRMVELLGLFPVGHIVAALAVGAELPLVHVLMAGDAILREAQKRLREVLLLNQRALRGNHVRRRMALLASYGRVLFHEWISGLAMIELLKRRLPMDERKILAIVLEVAPHAVPAIGILHPEKRVVALMRGQTVGNFLMAFQALERRRAGSELVTRVALG